MLPSMEFNSVNDFLDSARKAKEQQRSRIGDRLEEFLEDRGSYAVPEELHALIQNYKVEYGDEVLKQTAMYCLGKWFELHQEILDCHIENDSTREAVVTCSDMALMGQVQRMIAEIESFGGDEEYRAFIKDHLSQTMLERMEEDPNSPFAEEFFND